MVRRIFLRGIALAAIVIFLAACELKLPGLQLNSTCTQDSVLVPEGWFLMGQDDQRPSNGPQHKVYLDAFCIQKTEVTRQAYQDYLLSMGQENSDLLEGETQLPLVGLPWDEAQSYCQGIGKRLPTEAEWEKAARGTDGRAYPWGNGWDSSLANTSEQDSGEVFPVGSFPRGASPYGVLDMAGNAAEWVSDHYDASYYQVSPDHNPAGPTQVLDHGLRGGSYASTAGQATTYFRDSSHSVLANPHVGFRCASDINQ